MEHDATIAKCAGEIRSDRDRRIEIPEGVMPSIKVNQDDASVVIGSRMIG